MTDATARLQLPMLDAGQAQKEVTHNEALARLDLVVQARVAAVGLDAPPADPSEGQAWIVGDAPSGVWAGQGGALAGWTAGGWRFAAAFEGMTVWSEGDGVSARFRQGGWRLGEVSARVVTIGGVPVIGPRRPAIAAPGGGTTIDPQARDAIGAILGALRAHGLIAE